MLCINDNKRKRIESDPKNYALKNAEYYQKNKDRQSEWLKKDREINAEKHKEYAKKYHKLYWNLYSLRKSVSQHGITVEDFYTMLDKCGNRCEICGNEENVMLKGLKRRLCIDHDHDTKKVRGLLCTGCNAGIGHFKEDIQRMQSAIDYLKEHQED